MRAYQMRGTPTVALIDAHGRLRQHVFGAYDDLRLGRDLGALVAETTLENCSPLGDDRQSNAAAKCGDRACPTDRE